VVARSERVGELLAECDAAGIRAATVVSGGVAEELRSAVASLELRVLGPESLGVTNLVDRYVPRAVANQRPPEDTQAGGIAIVTQSGATSNILFNCAQSAGAGVAYSVNTGREFDIGVWELVDHLVDDDRVTTFMVVPEGIRDPERLVAAASRAQAAGKPIVLVHLGRSAAGAAAIRSHSGALAGAGDVHAEAFRRLGIVVVDDYADLWRTAALFERRGVVRSPSRQRRLGVLSLSGGEGALIADLASRAGLSLVPLSSATEAAMAAEFPECSPANPLDPTSKVLTDESRTGRLVELLLDGEQFTDLLVALPVYSPEFARQRLPPVLAAVKRAPSGVVVSSWSAPPLTDIAESMIRGSGVVWLGSSVDTVRALRRHVEYGDTLTAPLPALPTLHEPPPGLPALPADLRYSTAKAMLADAGIPFGPSATLAIAAPLDDVVAVCGAFLGPYVLKGDVDSMIHKSAEGLVVLGLPTAASVHAAMLDVRARRGDVERVVVEQQRPGTWEVFLGGRVDEQFGPVLVVGRGGTGVERVRDVALTILPLESGMDREVVARTEIGRSIEGASAEAFEGLCSGVRRVAEWLWANRARVLSVDVNPLMVSLDGACCAVDARIEAHRA